MGTSSPGEPEYITYLSTLTKNDNIAEAIAGTPTHIPYSKFQV